jgi:predicted short-subunit dehydrogenase-like oxidoreductase (DUF2520 family)
MKIVIIGTGNVAVVLGTKFLAAGHQILQVAGRSKEGTEALATAWGVKAIQDFQQLHSDADVYIIALSDTALAAIEKYIQFADQLVVHTAGSVSMEVLKNCSTNYGVFYPFQTIRKETGHSVEIPVFIDANNEASKKKLISLATSISNKVSLANDAQRTQYHLCAVLVNNFSNYLYALAEEYCINNGLDFNNLLPIIDASAHRLHQWSPKKVQTGPAFRNDRDTIQKHLDLLEDTPVLKDIYAMMSDNIRHFNWDRE